MKTSKILDDVELSLGQMGTKTKDRHVNLLWLNMDLTELVGKEQWDWAAVHVDPVVACIVGQRAYDLPSNFGDNFMQARSGAQAQYVCHLDDGDHKVNLTYLSPTAFYLLDLAADQESRPVIYTVVSTPDGRRQLILYPKPDDTYMVDGLYIPTDWDLKEESDLPPIPGNSLILKWALMRRYNPNFQTFYTESYGTLMMNAARQRKTQMRPLITEL